MMNIIWKILIGLFILDVIKKQFEKPLVKADKKEETPSTGDFPSFSQKEEEFPDNLNTTLDEDINQEEDIKASFKAMESDNNEEDDEEEEDKPAPPKKKTKTRKKVKKQRKKKKTILISYCKTTHQKYFEQFKLEMMGNFTQFEFNGVEHPVSPQKQFFSKYTFFTQIGVSLLIFGGSKVKQFLPFVPSVVFDQIEKNKWMIMIGNYFLHSYLKTYLASSYAFEVSIEGIPLWSKLATNALPKVTDIGRILTQKGL